MANMVLLDNRTVHAYDLEELWVEYDGDIYYVYLVDYDDKTINLAKKDRLEDIDIPISTTKPFKTVIPDVYTGQVLYVGEDVNKPTIMTIVEYQEDTKYSYLLKNEKGYSICATPFELVSIDY